MNNSNIKNEDNPSPEIKVLIVDDNRNNLNLISNYLKDSGFTILVASNAEIALKRINYVLPDIILLDVLMPPGENGYEVCAKLKQSNKTKDIPVIFMTSLTDVDDKVKAFELGAADYITKPIQSGELLARINAHLKSYKYQVLLEKEVKKRTNELLVANSRLLKSEESLTTAQRVSRTGSWDWNLADDSLTWSKETFRQFGLRPTETTPSYELFRKFVHPDDIEFVENALKKALKGEKPYFVEARMFCEDGSEWVMRAQGIVSREVTGKAIRFIGTQQDITDIKRAEQKSEELAKRLQQAQKMESIGTLAGGIAHDFNNILSSVFGFTELALEAVETGSQVREDLQEVLNAGERAKELVGRILAFARQSNETLKPIEIGCIVQEVLKFIRSTTPTTIELNQDIDSHSRIMGSSTQVHRVLMNLCANAAHAMQEEGGVLGVSLKDIEIDKTTKLKPHGLKFGSYVEIRVSDTGSGIEPQIVEKIFEPYFTTKEIGEGSGMGLAMVQGIVDKYRGRIFVESTLGKGTVFTIYIPTTTNREENDHNSLISNELPTGNERILFVDDEVQITKMASRVLSLLGYSVITKTNSVEALEFFRAKPDDFDLVISDVTMPNMAGDTLTTELLKIRPDIPVILCTGHSERLSEAKVSKIGIKGFAYKPMVKKDLAKMIRDVLDETQKTLL